MTSAGTVTDAPDWQRVVVSPGGAPVGGGGASADQLITPVDQGYLGWTFAPQLNNGQSSNVGSGQLYLYAVKTYKAGTIDNLSIWLLGSGNSVTADENYLGLYTPNLSGGVVTDWTLQASTATGAIDDDLVNPGLWTFPLNTGYTAKLGEIVYIGWLWNGAGIAAQAALDSPSTNFFNHWAYPVAARTSGTYTSLPTNPVLAGGSAYMFISWGAVS